MPSSSPLAPISGTASSRFSPRIVELATRRHQDPVDRLVDRGRMAGRQPIAEGSGQRRQFALDVFGLQELRQGLLLQRAGGGIGLGISGWLSLKFLITASSSTHGDESG